MKTKKLIALILFLTFASLAIADDSINSFAWLETLSKNDRVNICGSRLVQNTKNSLRKHFFLGNPKKGYVFSNMLTHSDYWTILREQSVLSAKEKMEKAFNQSSLWEISPDGTSRYLGSPKKIEFTFKSTVKDCQNGSPRYEGDQCKNATCCREKFPGVVVHWSYDGILYKLDYSPDPSVSLVITRSDKKERDLRFCHVQESFKWKADLHSKYRQECAHTSQEFKKNLPDGDVDVWCADGGSRKDFGPMGFDVLHAMAVGTFYEKRLDRRKQALSMLETYECSELRECKEFLYLLDWGIKSSRLHKSNQDLVNTTEKLRSKVTDRINQLGLSQ